MSMGARVLLVCALLFACEGERCREVVSEGERYCVAPTPAVIEGGIVCPPDLPFELRFERGIVCTAMAVDPSDLPPEVCATLGGCESPLPPRGDAGAADAAVVDAGPPLGTWRALPDAPHARGSTCASRPGGRLAYYGGAGGTPSASAITAGGAELELDTGTWTVFPATGEPGPRAGVVLAGTDTGWFVFGGDGGGGALEGGAFLADGASAWQVLPTASAPSARTFAVSAWTGREVIVFGGAAGATPVALGDGAAFDPLAFTWRSIGLTGAPAARMFAAAAWTGRELVVFGGQDRGVMLRDGGAYDPLSDSWRPISTADAPSSRINARSAWDGEHVIVWGGSSPTGASLRDGGAYDPLHDAWRAIPPVPSALVPFESPELVGGLAGGAWVVLGARDDTLSANAGARFDLAAWRWGPLELTGTPSARRDACGTSTDRGFIVVLGSTRERFLSDGAILEEGP